MNGALEVLIWLLAAVVSGFVFFLPWVLGIYLIIVGKRFKRSAHESGVKIDLTAFWSNWIVWVWMWAERVKEIVEAMPFFKQDMSETYGVKKDDGRIT